MCVVCIGRWSCVRVSCALGDGDVFISVVFGGESAVCVVFVCQNTCLFKSFRGNVDVRFGFFFCALYVSDCYGLSIFVVFFIVFLYSSS